MRLDENWKVGDGEELSEEEYAEQQEQIAREINADLDALYSNQKRHGY